MRLSILLVVSCATGKYSFLCPHSCLRIKSRETAPAVPSRVSLLILQTQAESGAYSRDFSRFPRRRHSPFIYLNRHTPSGQSRVYRVAQMRTDGVQCRESAGTGPVVLKAVPGTGAAWAGHHGPFNVRISFPTLTIVWDTENIENLVLIGCNSNPPLP